jgi:glycine/D-amino acid oxidase-like deaminating enzyme
MEVTRLLASWAGLRTFAPDRQLVLGPDPLDPSFLWCAGQGGYGFQTACAASRHMAEVAGGTTPTLGRRVTAALSPTRLR